MLCRTSGRTTRRSTRPTSTSNLVGDKAEATVSRPPLLVSPRAGVLAHTDQTLPEVVQRIFFVLPSPFERSDARVPFVVSPQAIASAGHAEGRIPSRQIGLRVDELQDTLGLSSLDDADEGP